MELAGEIVSVSPYYQNIRKHTTSAGEILCTGAGCIGCNPEKNADENIIRILGDIDSVDFERKTDIQMSDDVGKRPETASGCHRDDHNPRNSGDGRKATSKRFVYNNKSRSPKIVVTNCQKSKKTNDLEPKRTTTSIQISKRNPKINKAKSVTKPPTKDGLLEVPSQRKRVKFSRRITEHHSEPRNVRTIDRRRSLYNAFPGRVTLPKNKSAAGTLALHEPSQNTSTKFLDMLKTSEAGIYDLRILEREKHSIWIEKILQQGISEEQLLPRIPQPFRVRRSGDGSEREMVDKNIQTASIQSQFLPHVALNRRVETRGGESILIIEHDHEKKENADRTLYRLGFALEEQLQRNFPTFSIIEIAESLGEFVQMGSVKVIQRRNKRWLVLVEGKTVKDFLLDSGVLLGGRHFELFEKKTF